MTVYQASKIMLQSKFIEFLYAKYNEFLKTYKILSTNSKKDIINKCSAALKQIKFAIQCAQRCMSCLLNNAGNNKINSLTAPVNFKQWFNKYIVF
jgi:hypothetical protein